MNILAIEASGKKAYVSSKINNNLIENSDTSSVTHSQKLLPLIDKTLNNNKINNIDVILCTNGPGSFTGTRIAISTVKALAHLDNTKIVTISTLKLLAFTKYFKKEYNETLHVLSLIYARNNRAYYALYKLDKINGKINIETIITPSNDDIDVILNNTKKYNNLIIIGDKKEFQEIDIDLDNTILSSTSLINYFENTDNIEYTNYLDLDIVYARASQAERFKNENK